MPLGVALLELAVGRSRDDLGGPQEGLDLGARGQAPVEQVGDPLEAPRRGPRGHGRLPGSGALPVRLDRRWNASGSSACPTPASRRCFNALAGGGALAAPYPSPPPTPTSAWPRCPTTASTGWPRCRKSKKVVPRQPCSSSTSAGWSRGPARARASATGSSAGIREVDAIVYVLRAFDDADVPGPTDPLDHLRVARDRAGASPTSRRVENQLEQAAQGGQARQVARRRGRRARRRARRCSPRARRSTASALDRRAASAAAAAASSSPTSRCWRS